MFRPAYCCVCGGIQRRIIEVQIAHYMPPPLPESILNRLKKHQQITPEKQDDSAVESLSPKRLQQAKRTMWARVGSVSGIDPASLFPNEDAITTELTAEQEFWPTLQHMQEKIRLKNEFRANKKMETEKKIAENMAKMPKWIEKFHADQCQIAQKTKQDAINKEVEIEMAREKFGYDIPSTHPALKEYMREMKEKIRKDRKATYKQKKLQASLGKSH